MSTITYGIAAAAAPTRAPVRKRKGLFARFIENRQRQAMLELARHGVHLPRELEEAAQVDGANFLWRLWLVVIPVLRPSLATVFLINLVATWQEFFLPLIFSRSSASATLTLGITQAAVNPQYQTVAWGNEADDGPETPVRCEAMDKLKTKSPWVWRYLRYGMTATFASKKSKPVPVPQRSTCAARDPWYDLTGLVRPGIAYQSSLRCATSRDVSL